MNIRCEKNILLNNINIVLKAVATKTTVPILECILLIANDESFNLLASDLELSIEANNIEATIYKTGKIAVDAKILFDIIKNMPPGNIDIHLLENNFILIKNNNTEFKIPTLNASEFPKINEVTEDYSYNINCVTLKNMIKQTKFSVSMDNSKPIITGELLEIKDGSLNIVAIDGFRVSFRTNFLSDEIKDAEVVVPLKTLNEVIKILSDDEKEDVKIYFDENYILFEIKGVKIVSRLLNGEFIKYEQVFTKDFNTKVQINRLNFLNSLERASLLSRDNKKTPVKLSVKSGNDLTITSNTEFGSSYEEKVEISIQGSDIDISFNPRYLIEALRAITDDEILILFITPLSPCIIKSIIADDYKYLILPLKTN